MIGNEVFDKKWVGLGNLPEVKDDIRNIMQAVHMMGIPNENIYVEQDVDHSRVKQVYEELTYRIYARTRELTSLTGILGGQFLFQGLEWSRLK